MAAKKLLLRSLMRLLELVLPAGSPQEPADEAVLDPPMKLAVRVVQTWADVNKIPLKREWIVFSAVRCPPSTHIRSEIHWAIKMLFTRIRDEHAYLLEEKYRFKLELAAATATRAWVMIESKDDDEELDPEPLVDAYAGMFEATVAESAQA